MKLTTNESHNIYEFKDWVYDHFQAIRKNGLDYSGLKRLNLSLDQREDIPNESIDAAKRLLKNNLQILIYDKQADKSGALDTLSDAYLILFYTLKFNDTDFDANALASRTMSAYQGRMKMNHLQIKSMGSDGDEFDEDEVYDIIRTSDIPGNLKTVATNDLILDNIYPHIYNLPDKSSAKQYVLHTLKIVLANMNIHV